MFSFKSLLNMFISRLVDLITSDTSDAHAICPKTLYLSLSIGLLKSPCVDIKKSEPTTHSSHLNRAIVYDVMG